MLYNSRGGTRLVFNSRLIYILVWIRFPDRWLGLGILISMLERKVIAYRFNIIRATKTTINKHPKHQLPTGLIY
jgi:hypothetical protein